MAKVARAARVASRQRVEAVSADKTIASAETGELYLVDASAGSVVITLPAVQDGAYFKFILSADNGGGTTMTIQAAPNTVDIDGMLIRIDTTDHGSGGVDKGAGGDDKVVFGNSCSKGSYVEIYCDGTKWFAHGIAHDGTLQFA
tara:strand:+ start:119 stop:550 length:432 start_codon:yes stop_codon:yes gene_type:complete